LHYLERAMFVVGNQGDGKSSQIRDIFRDVRFHKGGASQIGESGRLSDWIAISNERYLHVRLTSPHEYGDGFEEFTDKVDEKQDERGTKYRWNFLGALQTNAFRNMPSSELVVERFVRRYQPERCRVVLIYIQTAVPFGLKLRLVEYPSTVRKSMLSSV
jgi:hypothetical protein